MWSMVLPVGNGLKVVSQSAYECSPSSDRKPDGISCRPVRSQRLRQMKAFAFRWDQTQGM